MTQFGGARDTSHHRDRTSGRLPARQGNPNGDGHDRDGSRNGEPRLRESALRLPRGNCCTPFRGHGSADFRCEVCGWRRARTDALEQGGQVGVVAWSVVV
jgi:hypothetical protein